MNKIFEQKYYSSTAKSVHRIGHDCIKLMKWIAYYDIYYEIENYYDLLASLSSVFK